METLITLIQQSLALTPERKEIYVQIVPYLSEAARAQLETILADEAKRVQEINDQRNAAIAKISETFFAETDELVRSELKKAQADKEAAQVAIDNPEKLLEQLDNL